MQAIIQLANQAQTLFNKTLALNFLAPLALRLYLAPIFIVAGLHKFNHFDDITGWFEHGLGLPFPELMAFLAAGAELFGGLALVIGFATRWISVPLMVAMLVAAFTVHWSNGWFAIASSNGETSPAYVLEMLRFPGAKQSLENAESVAIRLNKVRELLRENGNYEWLTEKGNLVVLNNGIEFSATYFIMLLALFFYGGGAYVSLDYWLARKFRSE